ncbi:ADP-ribose glycohydrolase OARD1 [Frankliniella fusca]|uniref:ADP-ribose glycohydrolase OARD1 n=1 Tax=Frankliniella fusca TaxID=407009 RepID=A0AAE1H1A7_9NEOP|nr:ADP-ribose glycohydrolase OARD1 [Frankliniella fusca]
MEPRQDISSGTGQKDEFRSRRRNEDVGHSNHSQGHTSETAQSTFTRKGTSQDSFVCNSSPASCMNSPASFQTSTTCTNCPILGCKLHVMQKEIDAMSLLLISKVMDLKNCQCDLALCREKIRDLENQIKQFEEKSIDPDELREAAKSEDHCNRLQERKLLVYGHNCNYLNENFEVKTFSLESKEVTHSEDACQGNSGGHVQATASNSFMDTLNDFCQDSPNNYQGSSWNSRNIRPKNHQPRQAPENRNFHRESVERGSPSGNDGVTRDRQQSKRAANMQSFLGGPSENKSKSDVVKEIKCDLFALPESYALAHCVGSDFIMSSGIAVKFRKKYRNVPELLDQNKNPGQVAFIKIAKSEQYIYYLVTKLCSTGKPKWEDFEKSVTEWRDLCLEHKISKIAIPKIGCGRDLLDWNRVLNLLNQQFSNTGIEITVCLIDGEPTPEKRWNLSLKHCSQPLSELDPTECALVFIASKDRHITPTIDRLARKYGFQSEYAGSQLSLGSIYHTTRRNNAVNIFGLVVKNCYNEAISFSLIGKCLQDLKRVVKKLKLWYIGFEAFDDPKYSMVNRKVWTVIIDAFFLEEIEVHFCWPDEVSEKCWEERK